jgi:hypothetical protein
LFTPGFFLVVEDEGCGFRVNSDLSGELGTRGVLERTESSSRSPPSLVVGDVQALSASRETTISNIPPNTQYTWLSESEVIMAQVEAMGRLQEGGHTDEAMGSLKSRKAVASRVLGSKVTIAVCPTASRPSNFPIRASLQSSDFSLGEFVQKWSFRSVVPASASLPASSSPPLSSPPLSSPRVVERYLSLSLHTWHCRRQRWPPPGLKSSSHSFPSAAPIAKVSSLPSTAAQVSGTEDMMGDW